MSPRLAIVVACVAIACSGTPRASSSIGPRSPDLLAELQSDNVHSFKADGEIDVFHASGERAHGSVYVAGQLPSRLLMVARSQGILRWEIACDDGSLTWIDHVNHCYTREACTADRFDVIAGLPFAPPDLLRIMVGSTPLVAGARLRAAHVRDGGGTSLDIQGTTAHQVVELDVRDDDAIDVRASTVFADSVESWRVAHDRFGAKKTEDGRVVRLPNRSGVVANGNDVLIVWHERILNIELANDTFHPNPPQTYVACP